MKSKLQIAYILISVLLLQPMLSPDSSAHAKRKVKMRAYSFITTGGKASQGECDGEPKVPRKLQHMKEIGKADSYLGSEFIDPELKVQNNEEMWKHYFRNKPACNAALAKAPSSLDEAQKRNKPELPPEESVDSAGDEKEDEKENGTTDAE